MVRRRGPRSRPLRDALRGLAPAPPPEPGSAAYREGVRPVGREERVTSAPPPVAPRAAAPAIVWHDRGGRLAGWRLPRDESATRRLAAQTPRAELDLHGANREEARRKVARFLREQAERGPGVVVIVVGRGRHSEGGLAVLRDLVGEWLAEGAAARYVDAFVSAPPSLGGTGAVLVRLRRAEPTA